MLTRGQFGKALSNAAVLLAVVLLLNLAATQVLHYHISTNTSESHCSICLGAHSVATPTHAAQAPVLNQAISLLLKSEPVSYCSIAVSSFRIRPPPFAV